jgi:hypothetical protein
VRQKLITVVRSKKDLDRAFNSENRMNFNSIVVAFKMTFVTIPEVEDQVAVFPV